MPFSGAKTPFLAEIVKQGGGLEEAKVQSISVLVEEAAQV
jgi:hypothetical protein